MRFALKLIFSDREEFYQKLYHFFLQIPWSGWALLSAAG